VTYVYGIVLPSTVDRFEVSGIGGQPVEAVVHGRTAALTSSVGGGRVRPSRANLMAHQQVVSAAHSCGPVLPVRFGTVMPDREAVVSELLEPERRQFETWLSNLDGKDEYRVKCEYLPDIPLRDVVARSRSLQRLRQRVQSAGQSARQSDRLALGELVMAELERLREIDSARMLDALAPHILAWEPLADGPGNAASPEGPLHAAVLVDRGETARLEAALERAADSQRGRMSIELTGPLPPWDFTHVTAGAA
jgi:hypothetical protein